MIFLWFLSDITEISQWYPFFRPFLGIRSIHIVQGTIKMVSGQKKIPKTSSLQTCLLVLDWPLFVPICTETLVLPAQNPWYYPTTLVFYTFYLKMLGSGCSLWDNSSAPPCTERKQITFSLSLCLCKALDCLPYNWEGTERIAPMTICIIGDIRCNSKNLWI